MVNIDKLREVFAKKLKATNNMDEAFAKAIWLAYNEGLKDALSDTRADKGKVLIGVESILQKGYE